MNLEKTVGIPSFSVTLTGAGLYGPRYPNCLLVSRLEQTSLPVESASGAERPKRDIEPVLSLSWLLKSGLAVLAASRCWPLA